MPLSWDARVRLLRIGGVAEELLASARAGREPESAFADRVDTIRSPGGRDPRAGEGREGRLRRPGAIAGQGRA
jgi:hypothetical protein